MMLYGLGVFLVSDFVHYWLHRVFHSRWLWEFHKVHHSATVLVPPTASRIHLVEKLSEILLKGCALALYSGAFYWLCGGSVRPYTLFGVGYLVLIFNSLAANLRHSHIWLSFGPRLEHIFNSPAQHQIHHSRDPRHFNHNFGINLSLWDWWFRHSLRHQPPARAAYLRGRPERQCALQPPGRADPAPLSGHGPQAVACPAPSTQPQATA